MCATKEGNRGREGSRGKEGNRGNVSVFIWKEEEGFVEAIHKSDKDKRLIIMLILLLKTCNFPKAA